MKTKLGTDEADVTARNPDIQMHRCIRSIRDRLGFCAYIQIIFGTVYLTLPPFPAHRLQLIFCELILVSLHLHIGNSSSIFFFPSAFTFLLSLGLDLLFSCFLILCTCVFFPYFGHQTTKKPREAKIGQHFMENSNYLKCSLCF